MSMEGLREEIAGWIVEFSERYCAERGVEPIWREPLVGFADAESPLFPELKVTAHPAHKVPQDYLPGARTVVSYFLPFKPAIPENNKGGRTPTVEWAEAYKLTNAMAKELSRHIAEMIVAFASATGVPEDFLLVLPQVSALMIISASSIASITFSLLFIIPCTTVRFFLGHKIPASQIQAVTNAPWLRA